MCRGGADALEERFGEFLTVARPDAIRLRVQAAPRFDPRFEEVAPVGLDWDGNRALLSGAATGWYEPRRREGTLFQARGLGAVDSIVRLALSLALPSRGALLLHGAAVARGDAAVALIGASGSGKSTAAAALDAACDELIVAALDGVGATLHATPYWGGRPMAAQLRAILCLEHGGAEARTLKGAAAVCRLLRHALRFLPIREIDAAQFEVAAELCRRVPVAEVRCPAGDAFVPFLERSLLELAS